MKKVGYLLLGLFLMFGLGCTKSDDFVKSDEISNQKKSEFTKTGHWRGESGYYIVLYCDEEMVDEVYGDIETHWMAHRKNGELKWVQIKYNGTLTSEETGEVFTIKETDKLTIKDGGHAWWHFESYEFRYNIKGNLGSHYIGYGQIDPNTWETVMLRANCPRNK